LTIKLKEVAPPPGEGKATIVAINLPDELAAGDWITGSVVIRNDGQADSLAIVIRTLWDNRIFGTNWGGALVSPGATATATIEAGSIAMPNQNAVIEIYACHEVPTGGQFGIGGKEYAVDQTVRHTINLAGAPPPVEEGKCTIVAINLPDELAAGEWVTGEIIVRNDGGADSLALIIETVWDGGIYGVNWGGVVVQPGQEASATIPEGLIRMPNQDATIKIYGCHEQSGGEFTVDSKEYKIDQVESH